MNEEEAIERLKEVLNTDPLLGTVDFQYSDVETVLNLLEKKDKEIQYQKEINKTEQNRHKQTEKSLKGQLQKKDKIIDLIAGELANYKHEEIICMEVDCKHIELQNEGKCIGDKECIKEYYERKLENGN